MESRSINDYQYNKEDEERYKRLLAGNDSIKRQIAEVSHKKVYKPGRGNRIDFFLEGNSNS